MIHIIIGHRGTGKSHWLNIISQIHKEKALCFDLDKEIEIFSGMTITSIFEKEGEKGFRKWEQKVFLRLLKDAHQILRSHPKDTKIFIAVGAGLVFKKTKNVKVIYLGRETDLNGRVFLDRPRLNRRSSPFKEYLHFYKKREARYLKQADETFFRMEHFKKVQPFDRIFLGVKKNSKPVFILRLNPQTMPKDSRLWKDFLMKRLNWGIRFFELHDETANFDFVKRIRKFIPEEKILFSSQTGKNFQKIKNKIHWSWDLSLGKPPEGATVLSLHQRGRNSLKKILKKFPTYTNYTPPVWIFRFSVKGAPSLGNGTSFRDGHPWPLTRSSIHGREPLKEVPFPNEGNRNNLNSQTGSIYHLKLAVEIFTIQELWDGLMWQRKDPKHRSFLPRSREGRWRWFRNAFPMPLHFIREGLSGVLDQPLFSEACHYQKKTQALTGVLGDPVCFSATPAEHNTFFYRKRNVPVFFIPLKEEEMIKRNLRLFHKMGFVFFAVTSPLKKRAFRCADVLDREARELKSVNLLIYHKGKWRGYNTDSEGLKFLRKDKTKNVVVWGGGGVRNAVKKQLPKARFYSARRGVPISPSRSVKKVDVLVWAVGRSRMDQGCFWPPKEWSPSLVRDLNYMEDSPGREYAVKTGAAYESGWSFFKAQAAKQQEIFRELEKK